MYLRHSVLPLVTLSLLLLASVSALGQSDRATVRGVVLDPSGAPIPDVALRVTSQGTGESRTPSTGPDGRFAVTSLPPGTYRVEINETNYVSYVAEAQLQVNQELWLEIGLTLGNVNEEILVTAPLVPLRQESGALGTVIDSGQISSLPLDGRNFLELSLLVPGAAPAPEGSASSLRGDFAFTVNGGREDAQSFLLDGVYNVDPKLNTPGVRPPVDAIREFEVLTNAYDASLGRNAAGQVNVVTHSGTNTIHGTLYGFWRTRALEARNFFAPSDEPSPDYNRGQYGGSIGGPIARDRTFFFADYEHTHLREGITRITNVPTMAERGGDFSALPPSEWPDIPGFGPIPVIPGFFINPIGREIAALYPEPNRSTPSANFVASPTLRANVDHFDVRIDHRIGEDTTLTTRYSFSDSRFYEPFVEPVSVPGYGTDVPRRGQNLAVGLTQPFSPTLLNDLRVAYSRVSLGVIQENQDRNLNAEVGLDQLYSDPRDYGLSQISITGFSPLGDESTSPQEGTTDMIQVLDSLTWISGAHIVKTGFEVRYVQQRAFRDVQARGFLNFVDMAQPGVNFITGNAMADLLLGIPFVTGGAVLDNPQQLRSTAWSGFLQDSWRVRPDLTLTAGLRYEYIAPAVDAEDRAILYDPASGTLVPVGTGTMPRGGYEPDRNNWSPRIGVAWTPDQGGRTVIRGGYGIYYNQGALATGEGRYFNPPLFDFDLFVPLPPDVPNPGDPPFLLSLDDPFPESYPDFGVLGSATGYQPDLKTEWVEHWNVSVQRQLGSNRMLEVAYVGSRGHDLIAARDINQPDPSSAPFNPRPNPMFDDVTFIESRGRSEYDALQITFQQRFVQGLSVSGSYTLGRSNDDASGFFVSKGDPNFPQDSRNPELEFGRSSFDVRHRFSSSFAWEMPWGTGRRWITDSGAVSAILADMELLGVITLQSGPPFTVALVPELDISNTGRSSLGFGANDRPNVVGDPVLENPTPEQWFDTSAYSFPAFGTFGDAGRNSLTGPDFHNINLGLLKNVALGETQELQIRIEAFNLFNRTNFQLPDAFMGSPTFGQVVSAMNPRRCQFGVKLLF